MDTTFRIYPIGIQNFEQLRNNNNVYVDKTELIYRLANTNKAYFLTRPRRFGKSLLVSTLHAYFRGKKELFQGLAMECLEKEWNVYPVLHLDFSMTKYTALSDLLDSNHLPELQNELREEMRKFFSPLKAQGEYLRFLFLTGISKFSQMSIFSELNNLQNISMRDDYSAICGITEQELRTQLKTDIEMMAQANNETYEEACTHLKQQYDGYHFSENCEDIYNPFSLFNAFAQKKYANFWFSTGTPTFLINILQQSNFDIRELDGATATAEQFDAPTSVITDPLPVLYQSGYLTIKGYDPEFQLYTFYQTIFYLLFRLMGQYVDTEVKSAIGRVDVVVKMQDAIYVFEFKVDGTPEEALEQINSKGYIIPYQPDHRKVVKVGVNFDSATRSIGDWKIVEEV